jgi:hypothetical protein
VRRRGISFGCGQGKPAAKEALGAREGVVVDEAGTVGDDVRPYVDLIADEDGTGGGEGFRDHNAEVFLMRGEDEGVGCAQRAPFAIAGEHAGPVDAWAKPLFIGDLLEFALKTDLIRPSHHQVDLRKLRGELRKGVEEEIAAFLLVETRHKEQIAPATELRYRAEKGFDLKRWIAAGLADAIGDGEAVPAIGAKAGAGEIALGGGGKENGAGIAQDGVLERPVEKLLEVFERIFSVEPRIESAVGEDGIGLSGTKRGRTDGDVGKDPEAIHHDAIEAGGVLVQPAPQTRGETEAAEPALTQGMNGKCECGEERGVGRILTSDFDLDTYRKIGSRQLTHRFGRTTIGGRETSNDVENFHRSRGDNNPSLSKEFAARTQERGGAGHDGIYRQMASKGREHSSVIYLDRGVILSERECGCYTAVSAPRYATAGGTSSRRRLLFDVSAVELP